MTEPPADPERLRAPYPPGYPPPGYPAGYPAPVHHDGHPAPGPVVGYPPPGPVEYPPPGPTMGYPAPGPPGGYPVVGYPAPAQPWGYPPGGMAPYPYPPAQLRTAPPPGGNATDVVIAQLPGTPFGLALAQIPPVTYGQAIGAMLAGIASIGVSLVVACFGFSAGPLVAGAFAILAGLLGTAGTITGHRARRTIRASGGTLVGAGMASAGFVCGLVGIGLTVLLFGGSLLAGA